MNYTKIAFTLLVLSLFSIFNSCVEEEPKIIPDVYVEIVIHLNLPLYNALAVEGNAVKLAGYGYNKNGVIVFRMTFEDYYAYDATCPQHIEKSTSINLDNNGTAGTATCPECNTVYSFYNYGYPDKGYPLKKYQVTLTGEALAVTN